MARKFQMRRDTAANWTSADPTLAVGEPGFETDTGYVKIGDGATAWTSLAYWRGGGGAAALSGITPAADKAPYYTGASTSAMYDTSSYMRGLMASANEATLKAAINAEAGVDFQAADPELAAIAGLTLSQGDLLFRNSSALINLGIGSAEQVLQVNSGATAPEWANRNGILQVVDLDNSDLVTTSLTSAVPVDASIPQNTEGTEVFSGVISPKNANSRVYVDLSLIINPSSNDRYVCAAIFRSGSADSIGANFSFPDQGSTRNQSVRVLGWFDPGSTNSFTITARAGSSVGGGTIQSPFGAASANRMHIYEVLTA